MNLLSKILGGHNVNLERAMTRTSRRHELLAGNLANVNTPGYKRRDMDFGIELEKADGGGVSLLAQKRRFAKNGPDGVRVDGGSIRVDGNSVNLEQEAAALAETELRFQALTEMTSRHFGGLKKVIREGR